MGVYLTIISLLISVLSLSIAAFAWTQSTRSVRRINNWSGQTCPPFTETSNNSLLSTHIFNYERHYHLESVRISISDIEKRELPLLLFRFEDEKSWLTSNFGFDGTLSHDSTIDYNASTKTVIFKASIGSDGFRSLKTYCYNRTGKTLMVYVEPLVQHKITVGDEIIWQLKKTRKLPFDKSKYIIKPPFS